MTKSVLEVTKIFYDVSCIIALKPLRLITRQGTNKKRSIVNSLEMNQLIFLLLKIFLEFTSYSSDFVVTIIAETVTVKSNKLTNALLRTTKNLVTRALCSAYIKK